MGWNPGDLITDLDLLALDRLCLTDFGVSDLTDKRRAAADWLAPRVEQAGFKLWQHQIRRAPEAVFVNSGSGVVDVTAAALDTTDADLFLSSVCAVPSSAALFVGSRDPFRGVYVGVMDSVNANSCVLGVQTWNGHWCDVSSLQDGTEVSRGKTCSGGGLVCWQQPDHWTRRAVGNSLLYWAKLTVGSSLTAGTAAAQLAPVLRSRLTLPAAYYTLGLLYQESYGANRGQWKDKADAMFAAADAQLAVALPLLADEFDVDADQLVDRTEVSSVAPNVQYLTTWERG